MFLIYMLWLGVLRCILPKNALLFLEKNGNTNTCTREALAQCCAEVPVHHVISEFNRSMHLDIYKKDFCTQCEQVAKAVCGWAIQGFRTSPDKKEVRLVQHMYYVLHTLVLRCRKGKRNMSSALWKLTCTLSHVLGLHDMWICVWKRSNLRVMLCGFEKNVQRAVLQRDFHATSWKHFVAKVFKCIWGNLSEKSAQYFVWARQQKMFYIGKANVQRKTADKLGVVARFREHVLSSFCPHEAFFLARRYRVWRNARPEEFFMVVSCWSDEKTVLSYERFLINHLQAPMQDGLKPQSFKQKKSRPWPRLRHLPSMEHELNLNVSHVLGVSNFRQKNKFSDVLFCFPEHVHDFVSLCKWQLCAFGRVHEDVVRMMYSVEHVAWLALYLAQKQSRLNYKALWDSGKARAIACGVWVLARNFEHDVAVRVQSKAERFLNTSPLTRCKRFFVKVPTKNPMTIAAVKRQVVHVLDMITERSPWWRTMLAAKIRVVRGKSPVLSQIVPSSIKLAKNHDSLLIEALDTNTRARYANREDVVKSSLYWDVPLEHGNEAMAGIVLKQLQSMSRFFRLGQLCEHFVDHVRNTLYTHVDENQLFLENFVRDLVGDKLAVAVDKDPKRRVLMEKSGFLFRLHQGYVKDTRFYEQKDGDREVLAIYRQDIATQYLPAKVSQRCRFETGNCQYAYHTYKGKCLASTGGLCCKKDHAHEREIVSDVSNPCKVHLHLVSRAVRLLKQLSGEHTWTLWNQSQLKPVLLRRLSHLKGSEQCKKTCPCGKKKTHELSLIKIDAAQFFKAASLKRGLQRVRDLLDRVSKEKGFDAIAVQKSNKSGAVLCKSTRCSDQSFRVVTFSCIRDTLEFIYRDRYFTVGSKVLKRHSGWPMGGSFSEPGTLVDLNEELRLVHQNVDKLKEVGWFFQGWKLENLVTGLMHVDDAVVFSKIFCHDCLETGMKKLWPEGVGISLEEVGPTVRMLHSYIHVIGDTVQIRPFNPNTSFALGFCSEQKTARLGPYLGMPFHKFETLKFFFAK